MLYICVAFFFFLDAVVIHLMLCRRKSEGLFLKLFLVIAFANLILMWIVFWFLAHQFNGAQVNFWAAPLYGTATVIYILLIPTYLVFYFSTQQVSPSKKILLLLAENGPMSFEELLAKFSDDEFVVPRIKDLMTTMCLIEHEGSYVLTPSGIRMAQVYEIYQRILGRKKGG